MPSNSVSQPCQIELFHTTCLNVAMNVFKSQIWKYSDSGGDRGMNLFDMRKDFTNGNQCRHTGARLLFRWLGQKPVKVDETSADLNDEDTLYDQHPWRMFVGPNLNRNIMQIKSIELLNDTGVCIECGEHEPVGIVDRFIPSKRPAALKELVNRTNQSLQKEKRFIKEMTKIIDFVPQR